jgi:plastocyanin
MRQIFTLILIVVLGACSVGQQRTDASGEPEPPARAPAQATAASPATSIKQNEGRVGTTHSEPPSKPEPLPEPESTPAPVDQSTPMPPPEMAPEPDVAAVEQSEATLTETTEAEPAVATTSLTGQVRIKRDGRDQRFATMHLGQTIIAWQPDRGSAVQAMPEQRVVTRSSRFFPQTMVVTSGTSIRFPNMDSIAHNVFSLTPGHRFDVGVYGAGEGQSHRFEGAGMVELFCNVHPNMAAFVLVLDTPHFTTPNADGRFILTGLPPGPGSLVVWNYRAESFFDRYSMNLLASNLPQDLTVNITRPSVPQHTNKHGDAYTRERRRR